MVTDSILEDTRVDELVLRVCGSRRLDQAIRLRWGKYTVGSGPQCTLRLDAPGVQPVHCLIVRGRRAMVVRSWASGVQLNGRDFTDAELAVGDRLRIGAIEFEVLEASALEHCLESPGSLETGPFDDRLRRVARHGRRRARRLLGHLRSSRHETNQLRRQLDQYATEHARQLNQVRTDLARQRESIEHDRRYWEYEQTESQHALQEKEGTLDALRAELDARQTDLDARLQALKDERDRSRAACAEAETRLSALSGEMNARQAELDARQTEIDARQAELDARQTRLDAQYQALEHQRDRWEAVRAGAQSRLDTRDEELDVRAEGTETRTHSLDARAEELEERLAELDAQRQALQQERQQWEAEHADAENRLRALSEDLDTRTQQLDAQAGEFESRAGELDEQAKELEAWRREMEARRAEQDDPLETPEATPPPSEIRFEQVSEDAPLSSEDVFRRLGTSPFLPEDEEEEEMASVGGSEPFGEAAAPADHDEPETEPAEDEAIDQYMSQLLNRVRAVRKEPNQPETFKPAAPGPVVPKIPPAPSKRADTSEEGTAEPTPEPVGASEPTERSARAAVPEKAIDLSAMRELANFSARQAIDNYSQRMLCNSVRGKLAVIVVSLLAGAVLIGLWWNNQAGQAALYVAATAFMVALFWTAHGTVLAGQLITNAPPKKKKAPAPVTGETKAEPLDG